MVISKNTVVEIDGQGVLRILWDKPVSDFGFMISLEEAKPLPIIYDRSELITKIFEGSAKVVPDPYAVKYVDSSERTDAELQRIEYAWKAIESLVTQVPDIYRADKRGELVRKVQKEVGVSRQTIYKHLGRYWQGGMTRAALLPDYHKCGARGVTRECGLVKRGAPRKYTKGVGMNVSERDRQLMEISWTTFQRQNPKAIIQESWEWLLIRYYEDSVELYEDDKNNIKIKIVDPDSVPTYDQYKYWFYKINSIKVLKLNRRGRRAFEKQFRLLLSDSNVDVSGPGDRYQIDATIIDGYIVSEHDRNKVLGRPTLYLVVDVSSRLIVGIYVGLEPPSWYGATMALLNCLEDKTEFCRKYDIELEENEWPAWGLPNKILGDRGEMESQVASILVDELRIELENTAPYRGDLKGIVESMFKTVQAKFSPYDPGYVEKDIDLRIGKDPRLSACHTLKEITYIIINSVLIANSSARRKYPGTADMILDEVPYVPKDLWNWGLENRISEPRDFDYHLAQKLLLPRTKVQPTREGLKFKEGLFYQHGGLLECDWYFDLIDRNKKENSAYMPKELKTAELESCHHPGDMSTIFVRDPYERTKWYECQLASNSQRFAGMSLVEINTLLDQEKHNAKGTEIERIEKRMGYRENIRQKTQEAERLTLEQRDISLSKKERIGNINANRKEELARVQRETAAEFGVIAVSDQLVAEQEPVRDADDMSNRSFIERRRMRRS
ncbi:MAG: hypothetical protein ABW072_07660 [Sedimenticola sp.]